MSAGAAPNRSDLADQLPADAYYHLIRTLRLTLPPPLTDSPDDLARRDHAAIARIAALAPANAAEADLAAQFVAASEQWKECLRLAQLPETLPRAPTRGTPEWAAKCRAQAISMMRQANSALRLLLRMQEARRKIEADGAACDRLAWTEHCALGLMAEALSGSPLPPTAVAASPRPSEMNPGAEPVEEAPTDPVSAAEEYATVYPERAALIRRLGRLPDNVSFGPPDDAVLQALIVGRNGGSPPHDRASPEVRAA